MSCEKTESEALEGVLLNGIGGRESPAVGMSGSKPLVNGDLREGDSEAEYGGGKRGVLTESGIESGSASDVKQGDVLVKVLRLCVFIIARGCLGIYIRLLTSNCLCLGY